MLTKLRGLTDHIVWLVTTYLDISRDSEDFADVMADLLAPMGYTVIANEHYVDLVQVVKNLGKSVPEEPILFSTFITNKEILDWVIYDQHLLSALVDEAYERWVAEDRGKALGYAGCWTSSVKVQPDGFAVQIEAELDDSELEKMVPAHIHPVSLDRCRELVADLESIQQEISKLGMDEWPVVAHLDEQRATTMDDLADEMLALLASNNLIGDDNG